MRSIWLFDHFELDRNKDYTNCQEGKINSSSGPLRALELFTPAQHEAILLLDLAFCQLFALSLAARLHLGNLALLVFGVQTS